MRSLRPLLAALGVAPLMLTLAGGAPAKAPARAQRLLITSENEFPGSQVRAIDVLGRAELRLTIDPGLNGGIAVSPDGTRLAYVQALSLDLPGEIPLRLRRRLGRFPQTTLQFGSFLLDTQLQLGGGASLFVYSLGGEPLRGVLGRPAWGPGGVRVVFAQARFGRVHLYILRVGGGAPPGQLTSGPGRDLNPRWSPDGRTIVFERRLAGDTDLYSVQRDGSGLQRLTGWRGQERFPDFSPDGRSLVFASNLSGSFQLYEMPATGGFARRLTNDPGNALRPLWSPDGRWIAFTSDRDGDNDAYLLDPRDGSERKLTRNATEDLAQDWQAVPDSRPPIVRALPSSGPRGRPPRLRFLVRDSSTYVRVLGRADLEFVSTQPGAEEAEEPYDVVLVPVVVRTRPSRVHILTAVGRIDLIPDEEGAKLRNRFRFCVKAVDRWGNVSRTSCATFRFRKGR